MKKLIILAACLLILSLTGCELADGIKFPWGKDSGISASDPVDYTYTGYDGAVIAYLKSDAKSLTVTISNESDSTWQSGNMRSYSLEVLRDGVWYSVEPTGDLANTMELMIFAPGEKITHTFDLYARYGELPSGHYRVVKSYWANKTETKEAGEFYLACEFDVE